MRSNAAIRIHQRAAKITFDTHSIILYMKGSCPIAGHEPFVMERVLALFSEAVCLWCATAVYFKRWYEAIGHRFHGYSFLGFAEEDKSRQ